MKKFNKFISLSLIVVMSFVVFAFAGCGTKPGNHTHAYNSVYTIEDGKAYKVQKCTCGNSGKTEIPNAIIVNPENAQAILDGHWNETDYDINNKVVVFNGHFTEDLLFRPTQATHADVLAGATWDAELYDVINNDYSKLNDNTSYHYRRTFNNIVFTATENTVFEGMMRFNAVWYADGQYDPVKGKESRGFTQVLVLNNIVFENLKFSGAEGRLFLEIRNGKSKNIIVDNCSFETDTITAENNSIGAAVYLVTGAAGIAENTTYKNNYINGHTMGLYITNFDSVVITGNKTRNTRHNGIAVQSTDNRKSTGLVVIENNDVANCLDAVKKTETDPAVWAADGERAMRIGEFSNANIIIRNNKFNNCYKQVFASNTKTDWFVGCKFEVYNNYYGDLKLPNAFGENEPIYILWTE